MPSRQQGDRLSLRNAGNYGHFTEFPSQIRLHDLSFCHFTNMSDDRKLAPSILEPIENLRHGSADEFFMGFGQLAADGHIAVAEDLSEFSQCFRDSMGCLEENDRSADRSKSIEPAFSVFRLSWGKALKRERVGGEARRGQGCQDGARAGHRLDANADIDRGANQSFARIGNSGRARVADERDVIPALEPRDERRGFCNFIVLVEARCRRCDPVARQQLRGATRVFRRDDRNGAKHAQRPHGDVFEVADGSGHHEQRAAHVKGRVLYH